MQAAADRQWKLLKEWNGGTGVKKTESFSTTGNRWRVSWKTLEGDPDPIGSLTLVVRDSADRLVTSASNLGQKISAGTIEVQSGPGVHYLEIESADRKWHVAAEE